MYDRDYRGRRVRVAPPESSSRVMTDPSADGMSDHSPPPAPIGNGLNGVTGGSELVRDAERLNLNCWLLLTAQDT